MKYNIHSKHFLVLLLLISINLISFNGFSQTDKPEKKWHYEAGLYLFTPAIKGETGIGSLIVPVDASIGDVLSNLKMAAMLYGEVKTEKWAITTDLFYSNLNADITPSKIFNSGVVGIKQNIWEMAGLYRILPFWEMGIGGRVNYIQSKIDARKNVLPAGTEEISGKHDATWFDPIIITRLSADINKKWLFQFRGDIGGFGIGSKLTYQLQAFAGYQITKAFHISAGYRILYMDYSNEVGYNQFIYSMNEFGPVIKFGFIF